MIQFHAVLLDETGCEFGADIEASTHYEAEGLLRERYPESRVVQLESPEDTTAREAALYARISAEIDGVEFYDDLNEEW